MDGVSVYVLSDLPDLLVSSDNWFFDEFWSAVCIFSVPGNFDQWWFIFLYDNFMVIYFNSFVP